MLNINKEEFREIYKNTKLIDYVDIFYTKPANDKEFIDRLSSKLWRLNNLYTIIDKWGQRVVFNMNRAQHKVYAASLEHPRIIILKSRQQGISTLWLISFFDDCIFYNDFKSGLMAQDSSAAESLLQRVKLLWDNLDDSIKDYVQIQNTKDNTKEFSFNNGSSIFIRTSFRSGTLQRLHISELGKIANNYPQKARETKTGSLQAIAVGNTVVVESTAEGDNMYKDMWDTAVAYAGELTGKDFKPIFLSWLDDPDCVLDRKQELDAKTVKYFKDLEEEVGYSIPNERKYFWVAQQRELGNDIYQEYPATAVEAFMKSRDGTYYAALYLRLIRGRKRELNNLFDHNLPVQVAVDLGRNDFFVLIFFQEYIDGTRIINSYKNSGFGIKHYCEVMDDMVETLNYNIEHIVLPHDAVVKDLTSDLTREERFWELGYKDTTIVPKTGDINNDRELVRAAMDNMFVDPQAQYIIDCFLNYTKEWDQRRSIWKDTHDHNDHSHGADAVRQMVRGGRKYTRVDRSRSIMYSGIDL